MDVRGQLLHAAIKVLADHGTRGATTRLIAQEAQLNEVTLFRHFGSKEALMHDAMIWWIQQCLSGMKQRALPEDPVNPESELVTWVDGHLQHLHEARAFMRRAMGDFDSNPALCSTLTQLPIAIANDLVGYLNRLRARGLASGDWNAHAVAALLMGAIYTDAMSRELTPERFPYSLAEAACHYARLCLEAVRVPQRASTSA
jgi:AcrR family transcriptional regulator